MLRDSAASVNCIFLLNVTYLYCYFIPWIGLWIGLLSHIKWDYQVIHILQKVI